MLLPISKWGSNMKKRLLILSLFSLSLISCQIGNTSSTTSSTSEEKKSETISSYQAKNEIYYKINVDFTIQKGVTTLSSGYNTKSVYIGLNDDGYESKVMFTSSYQKTLSSLDENSQYTISEKTSYYTPTKQYDKNEDGTYNISDKTSDIKPFSCPMNFSYITSEKEENDDTKIYIEGEVEEKDITSFLGNTLKDSSSITSMNVRICFDSSSISLEEVSLLYVKNDCNIEQVYTFDTMNSKINMPTIS